MQPIVEASIRDALVQAFVIDPDVANIPEFQKLAEGVTVDASGAVNESALRDAVKQMQLLKPNLFSVVDYNSLSDQDFDKHETHLREQLRKPRESNRQNEFRDLDCATLSDEELLSLRRVLAGQRSSWDLAILRRAQRAQQAPPNDAA